MDKADRRQRHFSRRGSNRPVFSFMARLEIKKATDLKGKKIGITRIGSSTQTATLFVLNQL